ncbi:MAG: hypothetical protein E6K64_01055 [Nitrospirae bacterium]|nr:MAG: hypothetical protein E6K64_01055 [Nitrospirota bacterium]
MKRRKMQSGYFSMITPALGTRELKWGTTSGENSNSTKTKGGSTTGEGGGDPICILGFCL